MGGLGARGCVLGDIWRSGYVGIACCYERGTAMGGCGAGEVGGVKLGWSWLGSYEFRGAQLNSSLLPAPNCRGRKDSRAHMDPFPSSRHRFITCWQPNLANPSYRTLLTPGSLPASATSLPVRPFPFSLSPSLRTSSLPTAPAQISTTQPSLLPATTRSSALRKARSKARSSSSSGYKTGTSCVLLSLTYEQGG